MTVSIELDLIVLELRTQNFECGPIYNFKLYYRVFMLFRKMVLILTEHHVSGIETEQFYQLCPIQQLTRVKANRPSICKSTGFPLVYSISAFMQYKNIDRWA